MMLAGFTGKAFIRDLLSRCIVFSLGGMPVF